MTGALSERLSDAQFEAIVEGTPAGRWWHLGYQAGVRDGYSLGVRDEGQAWTDVTTLACRTALGVGPAVTEMERRRSEYATPALSAEQIRARAAASWAAVEDEIRQGRAA